MTYKKRCRDCAYFSLASEGSYSDRCELLKKELSREEVVYETSCDKFEPREELKDPFYKRYETELEKYLIISLALIILGIAIFYIFTKI